MSSFSLAAWAWIPIVVWAALAQTVRNAAQRTLTAEIGTLPATLVRFLYGLPLAALWVLGTCVLGDQPGLRPVFGAGYAAWLVLGALAQVGATACLLRAMQERNFILAVAYSKTEVLQVALFSSLLLHELPGTVALLAMLAATLGVVMLSWPRGGAARAAAAAPAAPGARGRMVGYGLASGACFALASVGFRGASLTLGEGIPPWVAGGWGVLWAQLLQSLLLGGWLAARQPAALGAIARSWRLSSVAGSMGALASIAWFTAYARRPAAEVRTLGLVEVIFSYLVSRRVFGERLSRNEGLGLLLVTLGLVGICLQL